MIQGACHCGKVRWSLEGTPESVTACNCTVCRRYGTLWAYDFENEGIVVSGPTASYAWGDKKTIAFHFCSTCACVAYWRALQPKPDGRRRIAVNVRLAEPEAVAAIAVEQHEGLTTHDDRPLDGRRVADLWY